MPREQRQLISSDKEGRELPAPRVQRPQVLLRRIDVVFASITRSDILPGELLFNDNDNSLVYRLGTDTIFKWSNDATATI